MPPHLVKVFVVARFHNLTFVQNEDSIGVENRGKAMGDGEGRAIGHQTVEGGLDFLLGGGVERGGRLIENQNRWVLENGPGNGKPLRLPSGKASSHLADDRIISIRQFRMNSSA